MGNQQSRYLESSPVKTVSSENGGTPSESNSLVPSVVGSAAISGTLVPSTSNQSQPSNLDTDDYVNSPMIVIDCGHCRAALETKPTTTIAELYELIVEELDDEMIPGGGVIGDDDDNCNEDGKNFSFLIWIQNVQPTKKQVRQITVSDVIKNNWSIQLVEKKTSPSRRAAVTTAKTAKNANGKRLPKDEEITHNNHVAIADETTDVSMQCQKQKHSESISAITSTESSTMSSPRSGSSSSPSENVIASLSNNDEHFYSCPSPAKRSRIFSNSDTVGTDNNEGQTKNTLPAIVTPFEQTKRVAALADEVEQQNAPEIEHHCGRIDERKTVKPKIGSMFTIPGGKTYFENEMERQNNARVLTPDERIEKEADMDDNDSHHTNIKTVNCDVDADIEDDSDSRTVHLSLSSSSGNSFDGRSFIEDIGSKDAHDNGHDDDLAAVETWQEKNAKQMEVAKANGAFVELLDDTDDDDVESSHSVLVEMEARVESKTSDSIKTESLSQKSYDLGPIANATISLLNSSSDDDSNYDDDDNIDFNIRCVVARAGELGLECEKVEKGFFVTKIKKESQCIGKIFQGDILKSIDGKRLSKLDIDQVTKQLQESTDKRKRRIYVLRPKVAVNAQAGGLGLDFDKVPEGFVVKGIQGDSQLVGKVFQHDILTSIDGIQLNKIDDLSTELRRGSDKSQRRICILRKRRED